ncbi:MAG: hypothetical protein K0R61_495 [Microvirga sp.]|jgi:hypothetical protein|nr:hypothetical protein [Microvirga sp.]MCD6069838.1 hypothetical protein [Microvirga sp.]MDF2689072.1 hypothetical protein [Microvirga sp.]MDF2970045.1 hypothetical protein [Microvirga sp.]
MGLDDPFPIEKCSGRVRGAILAEFQGRCPTIREVASISDSQWLTVPNIGPTTLEELRSMTQQLPNMEGTASSASSIPDNELLSRLNRLQRELNILVAEIRTRLTGTSSGRTPQR